MFHPFEGLPNVGISEGFSDGGLERICKCVRKEDQPRIKTLDY